MFQIRNYKIGFDIGRLALFLVIMLPNFVWFAVPTANDVFRNQSVTPLVDMIASFFQVVMIAALCIIIHQNRKKPIRKSSLSAMMLLIALYYIGWCLYYAGIISPVIILDLCITPCIAFILFSLWKKNVVALISATIFMLCHMLSVMMNFIM